MSKYLRPSHYWYTSLLIFMANCKKNSSLVKISTFFTFHNFLLTHLKSFCSHQNCSCGGTDNLYFVKATVNFCFTSYTSEVAFEISLRTLLAPPTLHPTILCLAHSVILWTWHAYSCLRVRVFAGHWAWGALPAVLRRAYSFTPSGLSLPTAPGLSRTLLTKL